MMAPTPICKVLPSPEVTLPALYGSVLGSDHTKVCYVVLKHCRHLFKILLATLNLIYGVCVIHTKNLCLNETRVDQTFVCRHLNDIFIRTGPFEIWVNSKNFSEQQRSALLGTTQALRARVAKIVAVHYLAWLHLSTDYPEYTFPHPRDWRLDYIPIIKHMWNQRTGFYKDLTCSLGLGMEGKDALGFLINGSAFLYMLPKEKFALQTFRPVTPPMKFVAPSQATQWGLQFDGEQLHTTHLQQPNYSRY